ncbi:DHA2 family efflux MFS transporter permease subunit [Pengzhenrongella sp.]|jgi:EmrB/QacA subfamily drug resistance transporter|uniref:DHA2 family efflux MFS transporter permease subunit n=1 Tax=Pengzhenrongella sp. TaxID=2888820 RepID=UPI002F95027D
MSPPTTAPPVPDLLAIPASVWGIAAVVTFGSFMSGLDASLVNVGLDTIGRRLDAPLATTQWIASGYLLALAAALPASGWLSRRFGAGRGWLWSLGAFTAASGLCALAPSIGLLIAGRALQGVAGGLLVSTGMTVLAGAAGPERMGRVLSITGVPTVLAPALGPAVGALLLAHLSWQWLFGINLPVGVLGVVLGLRFVPRGERAPASRLDVSGLVLVAVGLPLVVFGITEAGSRATLTAAPVLLALLGGTAALVTFGRRSLRREHPLLDLRVFTNRVFAAACVELFFGGAALFGGQVVLPLYFQLQRERPIVETGLLLLPFGLAAAATFPIAGRLTDRFGGGRVAAVGLAVTAVATAPMGWLPADVGLVPLEALQVLRGVGLALSGAPVVAAALAAVARHQLADAIAEINILSRVGGALGGALLVVVLTSNLNQGVRGVAATTAFQTTFWWMTGAALAALAAAGWLVVEQHRSHVRTSHEMEHHP